MLPAGSAPFRERNEVARRKGKGTAQRGVKALGNGRYRVRVYVHGRDYIRTIKATNTNDAQRKRADLAEELASEIAPPERPKLSDVAEAWLERQVTAVRSDGTPRLAPTTGDRYGNAVRLWIAPSIGQLPLEEITPDVVRDWRDAMAEELAAASVNTHLNVLRMILGSLGSTAAEKVERLEEDDTRITDDEPNLLTTEELKRFLNVARKEYPQHYALILFLTTTGCRISTARAVRWEDLDPERGVVHLRRRISKSETLPGVKRSRKKKDTPPLLPEVYQAILRNREAFNAKQRESELVFPSRITGGPVTREILRKPFATILRKAKITKRFTPHGLRRSAALAYRLAGSASLAKTVLGHETDRMHQHYAPEQTEERTAAAERAFAGLV